MTRLLALYPRWWRHRYGDEMQALLELGPSRPRDGVDLANGALDAWLHPPTPSHIPGVAALVGGGLWTVAAAGVVGQPVPTDWPGYLIEVIPLATIAVAFLLIALIGVAVRAADSGGRSTGLVVGIAVVGYLAWIAALIGTASNATDGAALGAAQAVAMVATAAVGLIVIRAGDELIGALVLLAGVAMLVPWAGTWLVFGACWTGVGTVTLVERSRWYGEGRRTR